MLSRAPTAKLGVDVVGRIPLVMEPNRHNRAYLETKARKSGHLMSLAGYEQAEEDVPETADVG